MSPLHVIEAVVLIFGTIWCLSAVLQIYEARYIFSSRPARRDTTRGGCGGALLGMIPLFGIIGVFIAAILSTAGHLAQETGSRSHVYMDSFGPEVKGNFTMEMDKQGVSQPTSVVWPSGMTSWTDCFFVEAPRSGDGFLREWVSVNRERNALYRIAAGV